MKTLVGVALMGSILIVIGSGCGEDSSSGSADKTTTAKAEKSEPPPPPPPPKETPKDRVRDEVGDEVSAGGYAGDVKINQLSFSDSEVRVTAQTPEGGFSGPSCGDLDKGAQAIFKEIYDDTGWKKGAHINYEGGLVDSATGKDLPHADTGSFTMPAGQAREIDWSDDDVLLNIDWSIYREFCHPALQ
jgi:hypothetical protein